MITPDSIHLADMQATFRAMQASGELDRLRQQVMDSMLSAVKR